MMRRARSLCCLFLVLLDVGMGTAFGARVRIESDPPGLAAWGNERYLGRTPLEAILEDGRVAVVLAAASDTLFAPPVADTLLTIAGQESLTVRIRAARTVSIRSRPYDLPLMRDGVVIGRTPLDFPLDARRPGRLDLLTPSGRVPVPTDTLLARGVWSWTGKPGPSEGVTGGKTSTLRKLGRYALPGLAVGFAAGATLVKDAADRSYSRYLETADPGRIDRSYDETRHRDAISTALWTAAEACVVSSIIAWILPEHEPRRPGEGRP
jgi:hypothetical protein